MSSPAEQNRRRYPRASFACQLTIWRTDGSSQVLLSTTTNVGAGGVGVVLDQKLLIGTKLEIKIDFINPTIPFKCKAIIARCTEVRDHHYDIGLEFDGLDEIKQTFLQGKVAELIQKEEHGR